MIQNVQQVSVHVLIGLLHAGRVWPARYQHVRVAVEGCKEDTLLWRGKLWTADIVAAIARGPSLNPTLLFGASVYI
jgi:hypothetical protein